MEKIFDVLLAEEGTVGAVVVLAIIAIGYFIKRLEKEQLGRLADKDKALQQNIDVLDKYYESNQSVANVIEKLIVKVEARDDHKK